MQIEQKTIDSVLKIYARCGHYLQSATEEFPVGKGLFSISNSIYLAPNISTGHLNLADLIICINQLSYSVLLSALNKNKLPFTPENDLKSVVLSSLIYKLDNLVLKAPVDPRDFSITTEFGKIKQINHSYFVKANMCVEEGKIYGNFSFALPKRK